MRKDEIKEVVEMLKDNPDVVFVAIKKGDRVVVDILGDPGEICWTLHNCILRHKDIYDILNATIKTYDLVEKK